MANRLILRRIGGLCFVAACIASAAHAKDTVPGWLQQAALEKLPPHDADAVAVILLDDAETTIHNNGQIETLRRRAFRVLRPEARSKFGTVEVDFDSDTKISYLKAWAVAANGDDIAVPEKEAVDHGYLADLVYADDRVKTLRLPSVTPGSVVGFEYVQQNRPYVFEHSWNFQQDVPVLESRFDLRMPAGWEYVAKWFNHPEQQPQAVGSNEYVWQLGEQDAIGDEPRMPPTHAIAGWMGIKYVPGDPALRAKSVVTWKDIGLWYNGLAQNSRISTPAIHQRAMDLIAGTSDRLAQIRAITEYMQRNIRYFAIEIGIGGFQPHPAAEVFSNQYGDCKDKATLLSTMLKEIGVDSYYLAVDTHREFVKADYPSIAFNHMILAIKLPPGVAASGLNAVVNDPALGQLLIFDPTNAYVPLGYLPWYLQDSYGLVMGPDGGELEQLPLAAPSANRLLRTAEFTLSNAGTLSGEVHELSWGQPAHDSRQLYQQTQPAKRPQILDDMLQASLANFVITKATVGNLDKYDETFAMDYDLTAGGYAKLAGDDLLVRPRIIGDKYTSLLDLFARNKPRRYGIEFQAATRQDDVFDIRLPSGYTLDGEIPPVDVSCDFASYQSKVTLDKGVLHYTRTLVIQKVDVPAEKLADIKGFLQKVAADQEMYVALKPVRPRAAGPDAAN